MRSNPSDIGKRSERIFLPARMRYFISIAARVFLNLRVPRCITHFIMPINSDGIKTAILKLNCFVFDVVPKWQGAL